MIKDVGATEPLNENKALFFIMPMIFALFRLLSHIYNLRVLLALYPITTMTSFLCGPCNGEGWIFQDQVARTIYNGGDTARIHPVDQTRAQHCLTQRRACYRAGNISGLASYSSLAPCVAKWKQTTPDDSRNRHPPPVILLFYWFIARHVRQRTEQGGNIFQSAVVNPAGCSAMNFINLVCWWILNFLYNEIIEEGRYISSPFHFGGG